MNSSLFSFELQIIDKLLYHMKKKIFLLTFLCFLAALLPIQASDMRSGDKVSINNTVNENLYTAGGEINVNAIINGDLVGAGGDIRINESVSKDLIFAGGDLQINGEIGDDVRIAGGKVTISKNVHGELIITGGQIIVKQGVIIGGDIHIAGGEVEFNGIAKGKVKIVGGEVEFNGVAEQELMIKGGELEFNGEARGFTQLAAEDIELGPEARFFGKVEYWTEREGINFDPHLEEGASATFNSNLKFKAKIEETWVRKGVAGFIVYRIVSAALLITLLISFFDTFFSKNAGRLRENIGKYTSAGTLFMIGLPIAAVLAMITIIGIPVGLIMFSGYAIGLILAGALTATVIAYELQKYLKRDWSKGVTIAVAIAAFIVVRLIGMMAFPGKFIVFVLTILAIGSVIQWLRQGWRKPDEEPESDEASSAQTDTDMV